VTNIFFCHFNVLSSNEVTGSFTTSWTIEILLLEGGIVALEALGRDLIVGLVDTSHFEGTQWNETWGRLDDEECFEGKSRRERWR
jgi:hypothetical protein